MMLPDGTDTDTLDPGIRDTVAWLQVEGFQTSDSGDGVSKFSPESKYDVEDLIAFPHVIIMTAPEMLIDEARRLQRLLDRFHIMPKADSAEEAAESRGSMVQCSFNPSEILPNGKEFGIIMLLGVDDDSLSRATVGDES